MARGASRGGMAPALWLLAWLVCVALAPGARGGKVLVMPVDGSHWLSMKLLVKELSLRGHDALVLVPETSVLIQGSAGFRTRTFHVPYSAAELEASMAGVKEGAFTSTPKVADLFVSTDRLVRFTSMQVRGCEALLYDAALMDELRAEGFEVVLTDPFLPCGSILAHALAVPAVYFLRGLPCGLDNEAAQCPTPLSYVPRFYSGNTDDIDFLGRVKNTLVYGVEVYLCRVIYGGFDELTGRYLGNGMSYKELIGQAAIWLFRYDYTFEYPRPLMPNMVLIGGINCAKKAPLPADLQEFVDGSGDDGFVVFTLGSMLSTMPQEKAQQFFSAFSRIPQRVVWRYTGPVPDDAPANVMVMNWLPQNDLLGHPKVKAFITHGGTHGIYEGICNSVPMVMLPLFGDQPDNVQRMVVRGVAERLSMVDMTTKTLLETLNKVINDRSYKERMERLSAVHLDRPSEPLDLAAFWTEFVMRHKGAGHLRVAAHDLSWAQYHSLDVIGFLLLLLLTVATVTVKACLCCFRRCGRRSAKAKAE